jgi:lipoprotein-anchoring transpeptidase ErfK/SrfK
MSAVKRRSFFIAGIIALALVIAFALAIWRLNSTADQLPAETVIGGIAVGGLSAERAAGKLRAAPTPEIKITIPGGQAKSALIIPSGYLRPAVATSLRPAAEQDIGLWQRLIGSGGARYPLRWKISAENRRLLTEQLLTNQRPAVNAQWRWTDNRWKLIASKPGLVINQKSLQRNINRALATGRQKVVAPAENIQPELTSGGLRQQLPTQLLVDQSDKRLTVYRYGRKTRTYPVAVGAPDSPTPNGNWAILDRAVDPVWLPPEWAGAQAGIPVPGGSPDNPLVSRWMGIGDGVGIHGTRDLSSLGSSASKGCIRMNPDDVEELYELVPIGTPLRIQS